jgi:drug/metabolite transporter (DMT)-like permease
MVHALKALIISLIGKNERSNKCPFLLMIQTPQNSRNSPNASFYKPNSIRTARNILYTSIFFGIINSVINAMTTGLNDYSAIKGVFIIISILLLLFFLIKQMELGRKWARSTFLILFILGILIFPFTLTSLFKANLFVGIFSVVQALLQIVALAFLFSKESNRWFNNNNN